MSQMIGTVVQLQVLLLEVLLELGILTQRPTQCSIVRGPRDLTSSGQVNCPCAKGSAFFAPIVLPPGGRFAIIAVSQYSKPASKAV